MYERVMLGRYSPSPGQPGAAPPEVTEGFACEKRLVPWFAPPPTNAVPLSE